MYESTHRAQRPIDSNTHLIFLDLPSIGPAHAHVHTYFTVRTSNIFVCASIDAALIQKKTDQLASFPIDFIQYTTY